jgi:hypothetical protein
MRAVIDFISRPEILFPGTDTYHAGTAVMISGTEERIEIILAPGQSGIAQGYPPMVSVFSQNGISEMQFLAIPLLRPVNTVKKPRRSRNKGKP